MDDSFSKTIEFAKIENYFKVEYGITRHFFIIEHASNKYIYDK